jgi:tetratricopeptide (TPR) repeat protein
MKERVLKNIDDLLGSPFISTFHSFCVRFLREEINLIGYPKDFNIIDEEDKDKLVKEILKDKNIDKNYLNHKTIINYISYYKTYYYKGNYVTSIFNEAKELFSSGELRDAAEMFDEAKKYAERTLYPTDSYVAESDMYLLCISGISPSLTSDIEVLSSPQLAALSDTFCKYYALLYWADNDDVVLFNYFRKTCFDESENVFSKHIDAIAKMKRGEYLEAYHILKQILSASENISAPMLYYLFTDLEICCRELSDYRGAYEYSSDRTGMLEKFLG